MILKSYPITNLLRIEVYGSHFIDQPNQGSKRLSSRWSMKEKTVREVACSIGPEGQMTNYVSAGFC